MHFSGNLKPHTVGLFEIMAKFMRRENRLKELVHKMGGAVSFHGDEASISGITPEQFVSIITQLDKEFPS